VQINLLQPHEMSNRQGTTFNVINIQKNTPMVYL